MTFPNESRRRRASNGRATRSWDQKYGSVLDRSEEASGWTRKYARSKPGTVLNEDQEL